jgi:hypothetical protein
MFQHDLQRLIEQLQSFLDISVAKEFRASATFMRHCLLHFLQQYETQGNNISKLLHQIEKNNFLHKDMMLTILQMLKEEIRSAPPMSSAQTNAYSYQINSANWNRLKTGLQSVLHRTHDAELSSLISEGGVLDEKLSTVVENSLRGKADTGMLQWHGRDIAVACELSPLIIFVLGQIWDVILNQDDFKILHGELHLVVLDHAHHKTLDIYLRDFPWSYYLEKLGELNNVGHGISAFLHQWNGRTLLRIKIPGQVNREKVFTFSVDNSQFAFSLNDNSNIAVVNYLGHGRIETTQGKIHTGIYPLELGTADGHWYAADNEVEMALGIWTKDQHVYLVDDTHGLTWATREAMHENRYMACSADGRRMPLINLSVSKRKIA